MADRWIDYGGESVSVAWSAVAQRGFGYVYYGVLLSIVSAIEFVTGGITRALSAAETYLITLVAELVSIPLDGADAAATSTIEFLTLSGPLSFALGVVIVIGTVYGIVVATQRIVGVLVGGIA